MVKNNKKISISILASCVERDAFTISQKNYEPSNKFAIDSFLQSQSIFSMYSNKYTTKPKLTMNDFNNDRPPFIKKCMLSNIYKETWDLINSNSDYLIIGASGSRFNMMVLDESKPFVYTTDDWEDRRMLSSHPRFSHVKIRSVFPWDLDSEYVDKCKNKFVEDVKKRYKNEQIIINEAYMVEEYVDKDWNIKVFEGLEEKKSKERNEFLKKLTEFFEESFPGAHIIKMPQHMLAYELHKWGPNQLHFIDDYYVYLMAAIDIITQKHSRTKEEAMLFVLKQHYENRVRAFRLNLSKADKK